MSVQQDFADKRYCLWGLAREHGGAGKSLCDRKSESADDEAMLWFGIATVATLAFFEAYVLIRYPAFRRAFFEHWKPSAVAQRLDAFTEHQQQKALDNRPGLRPRGPFGPSPTSPPPKPVDAATSAKPPRR